MGAKVRVESVYKLFGPNPKGALERLRREGLSKDELLRRHRHTVGLRDVSFTVNEGEVFVVMGLSGSGKSTLVRCINRLIDPTAGLIEVDGEDLTAMGPAQLREVRRKKMAMVFQSFALLPHRTVLDNVAFGLELQGVDPARRRERAREVIAAVGLEGWEDSLPEQLSGGMQQRVGLARALATDPDVLLMDEPFSALDPLIRREMQEELLRLQRTVQKTILFVTHDLDEALHLGDRIAIMKDARVVQVGTPEEILAHPADDYVRAFVQDVDRSRVFKAAHVMIEAETVLYEGGGPRLALRVMRQAGRSSVFVVDHNNVLKGLVTADDAVDAVQRGEVTLDDILVHDYETTGPETLLADLIPVAARTRYPIAVVDEGHRLLGLVARVSLLAGLVGEPAAMNAEAAAGGGRSDAAL